MVLTPVANDAADSHTRGKNALTRINPVPLGTGGNAWQFLLCSREVRRAAFGFSTEDEDHVELGKV